MLSNLMVVVVKQGRTVIISSSTMTRIDRFMTVKSISKTPVGKCKMWCKENKTLDS